MCTILGKHISLIRPSAPRVHITSGAWAKPRRQKPKTIQHSWFEKELLKLLYEAQLRKETKDAKRQNPS